LCGKRSGEGNLYDRYRWDGNARKTEVGRVADVTSKAGILGFGRANLFCTHIIA